jgi:hypothetical protein
VTYLVIDVQIVMIGSDLSSPPDDGTCRRLLDTMKASGEACLVWDDGGLIRAQYDNKVKAPAFGRVWLEELLLRGRVISVPRAPLPSSVRQRIRATGLVGEDLNYYVRTAASSPDRLLVSQDKDYDTGTCHAVKRELLVVILSAAEACGVAASPKDVATA